jgi:hypothetical protein
MVCNILHAYFIIYIVQANGPQITLNIVYDVRNEIIRQDPRSAFFVCV